MHADVGNCALTKYWCGVAQRAKELLLERCSSEILQDLSTVSCYYQGSGRRVRKSFNIDAKKAQ